MAQAARIGGQHQRDLAKPGSQSPGQGMRQFLSQVPRILTALLFACLSRFCSPSSQSLLLLPIGPPATSTAVPLHLEPGGRVGTPRGDWNSAVFLAFSESLEVLR